MKDRLITAVGALAALLTVYGLLVGGRPESPVTRPLSTEAGRNGYLALANWLQDHDVPVRSWRERFDELVGDGSTLSPAGNIMLTTMPHRFGIRLDEHAALNGWIRQGNTLLILAALDDSPEWTSGTAGARFVSTLSMITGMGFRTVMRDEGADEAAPYVVDPDTTVVLETLEHPLTEGVARLEARSDLVSSLWTASTEGFPQRPYLRLAVERETGAEAIWQVPARDGQILLVASGSLLTNSRIAEADTARFVANVVAHHLGPQGAFVFDDMHQGLSALYDPQAFYGDPRLHATIGFLIAAWLVYLLGSSNRLAPVRASRAEPRQVDLLAAVGGFMARRVGRRETGLLLFDDWFREIRRDRGLPDETEPPWQALAATPTLSGKRLQRLRELHERLERGHAVDLVVLHNRIRQARKAIG